MRPTTLASTFSYGDSEYTSSKHLPGLKYAFNHPAPYPELRYRSIGSFGMTASRRLAGPLRSSRDRYMRTNASHERDHRIGDRTHFPFGPNSDMSLSGDRHLAGSEIVAGFDSK